MRVLYVEDDLRDADVTVRMLRKIAPSIEMELKPTIESALVRLSRLDSLPLDVVLTDMHLADGDGLSLLKYIRENNMPVAVVVVTGLGDEDTAVAALKARADDYVVKQKDYLDRLPVILESALNHYRVDSARRTRPLEVLYVEHAHLDRENTKGHFSLNADHIHLHVISTAAEALYMLKHVGARGDYDVLLLDFELPELNALELLRELQRTPDQDIPVVIVCSPNNEELASQCLKRGAASYVVKRPGYLYQLPWELEDALSRAEMVRREVALAESQARNHAILSAMPDLMFLIDRDGTFLDYHAKDLNSLFVPPEQFIGRTVTEVMPPQLAAEFTERFEEAFASDSPVVMEYTLPMPGASRVFEASIVNCDGDKILSIVRDITERKEGEESLKRALAEVQQLKDQLYEENIYLQEEMRETSNFGEIIGRSPALKRVLNQAEQVAALNTTVLLLGETGTGKELLAHAIHNLGPRSNHTLVKVNCAALPGPLIESELFGHAKGAFTGADTQRRGRFEIANGGSLFLDEVGELPLDLQAKLLRVLDQAEFEMVGSSRTRKVDVRVIAATNRDLSEAVANGTFRSDLFYRLSIFPITIPPLRERREDIPMLVTHLVKQLGSKFGKKIETIPQKAMTALQDYDWPGNVRELRNVIERAVIITQDSKLRLVESLDSLSLEAQVRHSDSEGYHGAPYETLQESEYKLILQTLKKVHWRVEGPGGAAELLDVHASTLRSRMKKLGISRPKVQASPG